MKILIAIYNSINIVRGTAHDNVETAKESILFRMQFDSHVGDDFEVRWEELVDHYTDEVTHYVPEFKHKDNDYWQEDFMGQKGEVQVSALNAKY